MFVSKRRFDFEVKNLEAEIARLNDLYWALCNKHERLMNFLGVQEHKVNRIEIRSKGGPEKEQ